MESAPVTLSVPAKIVCLSLIDEVVMWCAKSVGLEKEECRDLSLAVDEACTNVMSYAYPEGVQGQVSVVCAAIDKGLSVTIIDHGQPFDPKDGLAIGKRKREQDPASGGRGLLLIYQLVDETAYEWSEQKGNRFTLIKHAKSTGGERTVP